jgi:hypothetical protein
MSDQARKARQVDATYDMPETPYPSNFVVRDECFTCGDYGWCVLILSTPTADHNCAHMMTCGRCLGQIGTVLSARPLEVGRLEGYEMTTVTVQRTGEDK